MLPVFGIVTSTPSLALRSFLLPRGGLTGKAADMLCFGGRIKQADLAALLKEDATPDERLVRELGAAVDQGPALFAYRSALTLEKGDHNDEDNPGFRFVMSTAAVDRDRDIVEQDFRLEEFRANPVAPWAHNYRLPVVGRWESVEISGEPLALRGMLIPHNSDVNPLGQLVASQLAHGFLRTVSVGFIPGAFAPRSGFPEDDPRFGGRGFVLSRNLLLEASPTPIPMNPQALMQSGMDSDPKPEDDPLSTDEKIQLRFLLDAAKPKPADPGVSLPWAAA